MSSRSPRLLAVLFVFLFLPGAVALADPQFIQKYQDFRSRQEWGKALEVVRAEIARPTFTTATYLADIRSLALAALGDVALVQEATAQMDEEAARYHSDGLVCATNDPLRRNQLDSAMGLYYSKSGRNGLASQFQWSNLKFWLDRRDRKMTIVALGNIAALAADRGQLERRNAARKAALRLAKDHFVAMRPHSEVRVEHEPSGVVERLGVVEAQSPTTPNDWLIYSELIKRRIDDIACPAGLEEVRRLQAENESITKQYFRYNWIVLCQGAKALAICGDRAGALAKLEAAEQAARTEQPIGSQMDLLTAAAQVHFHTGEFDRALKEQEAWLLMAARAKIPVLPVQYQLQGDILTKLGDLDAAIRAYERAIKIVEKARSMWSAADRAEFFRSTVRRSYWGLIHCLATKAQDSGAKDDLFRALAATETLRARQFGERLQLTEPLSPSRLSTLQANLKPRQAIVDYVVVYDRVIVFVLTPSNLMVRVLPVDRSSIVGQVGETRGHVAEVSERFKKAHGEYYDKAGNLKPGVGSAYGAAFQAFLLADRPRAEGGVRVLRQQLVDPVLSLLKDAREIIALPDGELCKIPLTLLWAGLDPRNSRVIVRHAPSLRYLLRERRPASTRRFLGVGDPAYREQTPLPNTRTEVEAIAALFKDNPVQLFDTAATKANVLAQGLQKFGYLHFSTHGYASYDTSFAGLVFARGSGKDEAEDWLTAPEVEALHLDANVTVLSACLTGSGRHATGEGILGMGRAFLIAGSRTVVASLWAVNTRSTEELMVSFYKFLISENCRPSEALFRARQDLVTRFPEYRHPYYWAPFVVIGD